MHVASNATMAGIILNNCVCVVDFVSVQADIDITVRYAVFSPNVFYNVHVTCACTYSLSVCDAVYSVCICHFSRVCCTDEGHINTGLAPKDALTAPYVNCRWQNGS